MCESKAWDLVGTCPTTNQIFSWKIGVLDDYHFIVTISETLSASGNNVLIFVFAFIGWYP